LLLERYGTPTTQRTPELERHGKLFQGKPGEAQAAKSDANGAAVREAYMNCATRVGQSSPLGVTIAEGGANFSLFSRSATDLELLFFDNESDDRPSRVIRIDPAANRIYHYWHLFVSGVESGLIYGYRVQGPSDPSRGMRFDRTKILLGVVQFVRLQNALKSANSKTASVDWIEPNPPWVIYRAFRLWFYLGPVARGGARGLTTHSRTRRVRFSERCQMKVRPQGLVLVGGLQ